MKAKVKVKKGFAYYELYKRSDEPKHIYRGGEIVFVDTESIEYTTQRNKVEILDNTGDVTVNSKYEEILQCNDKDILEVYIYDTFGVNVDKRKSVRNIKKLLRRLHEESQNENT